MMSYPILSRRLVLPMTTVIFLDESISVIFSLNVRVATLLLKCLLKSGGADQLCHSDSRRGHLYMKKATLKSCCGDPHPTPQQHTDVIMLLRKMYDVALKTNLSQGNDGASLRK